MAATPPVEKKTPSLRTRILRSLLLSVFSVFFTLFLIEMIVRIVPLYPDSFFAYDSMVGWRHIPDKEGTYLYVTCLNDYRQRVSINAQGLHDVDHTYERQGDAYRVLVLGDSLVASFEVPLEANFLRQANSQLSADGAYEILNGGHQGYSTGNELMFYREEGRRYDPDMVILVVEPVNDIIENNHILRYNGGTYYPYFTLDENRQPVFHEGDPAQINPDNQTGNVGYDALYEGSYLFRLITKRSAFLRGVKRSNQRATDQSQTNAALDITAALLREMRDTVQDDGVTFGVIIAPFNRTRGDSNLITWDWLAALMTDENIPYLNPQAQFDAAPAETPLFYPCDKYHWTPAGHALMGEVLADFVRDSRSAGKHM